MISIVYSWVFVKMKTAKHYQFWIRTVFVMIIYLTSILNTTINHFYFHIKKDSEYFKYCLTNLIIDQFTKRKRTIYSTIWLFSNNCFIKKESYSLIIGSTKGTSKEEEGRQEGRHRLHCPCWRWNHGSCWFRKWLLIVYNLLWF